MAGYIGSKTSVTQVDGYNRTEADAEFVNDPNSVISVSGSNVGIGTDLPTFTSAYGGLHVHSTYPEIHLTGTDSGSGASDGFKIQKNSANHVYLWNYENAFMAFGTNNSERLRIDSSGRVTMPYQPAFHAMAGSFNNISSGNLIYNSATFNTGNHYNTSTGNFTAPVAGVYQFHASCYSQSGTGTSVSAKITVNGVMRQIGEIAETGGNYGYDGINMSVIVYLSVNDVVAAQYRAGGQLHLNSQNNSFSGALIG